MVRPKKINISKFFLFCWIIFFFSLKFKFEFNSQFYSDCNKSVTSLLLVQVTQVVVWFWLLSGIQIFPFFFLVQMDSLCFSYTVYVLGSNFKDKRHLNWFWVKEITLLNTDMDVQFGQNYLPIESYYYMLVGNYTCNFILFYMNKF